MTTRLESILSKLREALPELRAEFHIDQIAVFGSVARGEARPDSDVDILVSFTESIGLFRYCALIGRLEQILGCPVDLVTVDAIRPSWKEGILREAVRAA